MKSGLLRSGTALFLLGALGTAALPRPLLAQTGPVRPAVRIGAVDPRFAVNTWPVDLNRDGKTDIVSATGLEDQRFVYALGAGDGTFGSLVETPWRSVPLGTGDFDNDGDADVVVSGVAILESNGDGTFAGAHPVSGPPAPSDQDFYEDLTARDALDADFDGDGVRDLALVNHESLDVYPGRGNFQFGAPASYPFDSWGFHHGVPADFTGDGRQDIAVSGSGILYIFVNTGAGGFQLTRLQAWGNPIAAGDLNRDGRADLLVAQRGGYARYGGGDAGSVQVYLGNGDGTFAPAGEFTTGKQGVVSLVVGDFNMDGLPDAATGNRSWKYVDTSCGPGAFYWDSVTILPGRGDGTLGSPAAFALAARPVTPMR
jgi:hypothetical protein